MARQKHTKRTSKKTKKDTPMDAFYKENVERLQEFDSLLSPFWSARSGHIADARHKIGLTH
jgi:hypothetical protein